MADPQTHDPDLLETLWGGIQHAFGNSAPPASAGAGSPDVSGPSDVQASYLSTGQPPGVTASGEPEQAIGNMADAWYKWRRSLPPPNPQDVAMGMTPMGIEGAFMGPIKAYHGSPYSFSKFDLGKIGTGEGAQMFGHGLYFADREGVAQGYKHSTSDLRDWPVTGGDPTWRVPSWVGKQAAASPAGLDAAIADFKNRVAEDPTHWNVSGLQSIVDALEAVKADKAQLARPGHMYEVEIGAEPHQLLDWDKPLSEQSSQVLQGLADTAFPGATAADVAAINMPGHHVYAQIAQEGRGPRLQTQKNAGDPVASMALNSAGIPGLQYLDQGSRAAGAGTRNYVIWNPDIIRILRRYGIGGLSVPTAASLLSDPQEGS